MWVHEALAPDLRENPRWRLMKTCRSREKTRPSDIPPAEGCY